VSLVQNWQTLYRPHSFSSTEFVLPNKDRQIFEEYCSGRISEHLLLSGTPGTGKTTAATLLLEKAQETFEIDCPQNSTAKHWKEGSLNWMKLVSPTLDSVNLTDAEREKKPIKRCVLLEEFEAISSQKLFKTLLDKATKSGNICILTTNELGGIDKAVQSRCMLFEFGYQSTAWMNFEDERIPGARGQIEANVRDLIFSVLQKEAPKSEELIKTQESFLFFSTIIKEKYPSVRNILEEIRKYVIDERLELPNQSI
jgi:DNA polymerase III delta prime subunit